MAILVYIEQASGKIKKTSLEAVSYAFALAQKTGEGAVIALALGTVEEQELAAVGEALRGDALTVQMDIGDDVLECPEVTDY